MGVLFCTSNIDGVYLTHTFFIFALFHMLCIMATDPITVIHTHIAPCFIGYIAYHVSYACGLSATLGSGQPSHTPNIIMSNGRMGQGRYIRYMHEYLHRSGK